MTEKTLVRVDRLIVNDQHERQFLQLQEAEPGPEGERRSLTIVIGPAEAGEISRGLTGVRTTRPLTHELLSRVVQALGARIAEVHIHDLREGVYFATLVLEHQGERLELDCRPSDGVALALRAGAPVYLAPRLFREGNEPG